MTGTPSLGYLAGQAVAHPPFFYEFRRRHPAQLHAGGFRYRRCLDPRRHRFQFVYCVLRRSFVADQQYVHIGVVAVVASGLGAEMDRDLGSGDFPYGLRYRECSPIPARALLVAGRAHRFNPPPLFSRWWPTLSEALVARGRLPCGIYRETAVESEPVALVSRMTSLSRWPRLEIRSGLSEPPVSYSIVASICSWPSAFPTQATRRQAVAKWVRRDVAPEASAVNPAQWRTRNNR